jgi:hypothetical protein
MKEAQSILYSHKRKPGFENRRTNELYLDVMKDFGRLKSRMEDLMFKEYPQQATVNIFYGESEPKSP